MTLRILLASALALTSSLAAQTGSVRGLVAFPLSSSRLTDLSTSSASPEQAVDRGTGIWVGIGLDARLARFSAALVGIRGSLDSDGTTFPERDGGEIAAVLRYQQIRGLAVEARYTQRAFSSGAGRRSWSMGGVGVSGSMSLGTPAVHASGGLAYLPVVRVSELEDPRFGVTADLSLFVTPTRAPLVLAVGYRIERFVFAQASAHAEQFEALTVSLGVRVQRRDGRWSLAGSQ